MWTKSQKISASVLGLAVVAFVVDRWVLDGGAPAAPQATEQLLVSPPSAAPAAAPAPASPVAVATPLTAAGPVAQASSLSLASRLAALAEARRFQADATADAFRPSEQWLAAATPPAPAGAKSGEAAAAAAAVVTKPAAPAAPKFDYAGNFTRTHTLTAVMHSKDGGMAIINGKLYRPGQYVDGFKLTKVNLKDARFWGKGSGATLKLAGQARALADAR